MPKKFTYEEVKKYIEDKNEELLSDKYINNRTKIKIKCKNGHEYDTIFKDYKRGHGCPVCSGSKKYTYEEVKLHLNDNGYELLSNEYHRNNENLMIKCPEGHVVHMRYSSFKSGRRCKICARNQKHDINYIKETLNKYGYILLDDKYINNDTKLNMRCYNGHDIQLTFKHFKRGIRCQKCSCSSGESEIIKILDENNIKYIHQYSFDDCKDIQTLPFDFYIPDKNICIEYDGIQHFKPIEQFGGLKAFEDRKRKDEIKTFYCKQNNINLLRIPYWDFFNLQKIIQDKVINI